MNKIDNILINKNQQFSFTYAWLLKILKKNVGKKKKKLEIKYKVDLKIFLYAFSN